MIYAMKKVIFGGFDGTSEKNDKYAYTSDALLEKRTWSFTNSIGHKSRNEPTNDITD